MGTAASKQTPKWEVIDENPSQNQFIKREWIPKVVKKIVRRAIPVGTFSVRLEDDDNLCDITGAAFLPNGDVFIADRANKKLKLFDKKGKYKISVQMPTEPMQVASIKKYPYVYITFPGSCKIRQVEVTKDDMKRIDTFQTVGKCTAITNNRHGGLAVSVNVKGNQWQLHLMNQDGKLQKRVHGETLFLNPQHLAVTKDLNLVISDHGNNTVYHLTADGYVIFAYKDIRSPLDVFVDKEGYIYVAGPEKIHQLNERGEKVQFLLSKVEIGFAPVCMKYYDKDDLLLIAGRSDKVMLYELKG